MQNDRGPVVNLYNAATATAKTLKGNAVTFTIDTKFPLANTATITIDEAQKEKYDFMLRIPGWSTNTIVKVNGKAIDNVVAGKYLTLTRKWKKGDCIRITFDMRAKLIDAPKGSNPKAWDCQALVYGPLVLSRDENIDPDYNKPVQIIADENRNVHVQRVVPEKEKTRIEFLVPTTTGTIRMVDYSSVDGWHGKQICTWLPRLK